MNKHTPGPWRIDGQDLFQGIGHDRALMHAVIRSEGEQWTSLVEIEDGEGFANARLIASAPELLEALEALLESAICANASQNWATGLNDEPASFDQARAAIRKARCEA